MRDTEPRVVQHYTHGSLEQAIMDGFAAMGAGPDRLTTAALSVIDEFHVGGLPATIEVAERMDLSPGLRLLDVGCGIGGPARYFAEVHGCSVAGVDLTQEYVEVAAALSRRVGLASRTRFLCASALDLPFGDGVFDGAYMMHVGMNVGDKAALFGEVRRVLKPGAVFAVYDVMREAPGELRHPLPWASSPDFSFLETAAAYSRLLSGAGFEVGEIRGRREMAIEFFHQVRARAAAPGGPPPIGLHMVMGKTAPQKVANILDGLERGLIAPTELVCRAGRAH